jgi:hypothetical protein
VGVWTADRKSHAFVEARTCRVHVLRWGACKSNRHRGATFALLEGSPRPSAVHAQEQGLEHGHWCT